MPYIGKSIDGFGIRERFTYVASAGATSISGADANARTLTFEDPEYVDVFLNGVRLKKDTDYDLNTANTVSNLSALVADDEVEVIVNDIFTLADMVSANNGGDFRGSLAIAKDETSFSFGLDKDITLTHVHNAGLNLKNVNTSDDSFATLTFQTGDTDIAVGNKLGSIKFQAPDEGTGTDAILVAAGIEAVSEGDFSASSNATKLSFLTGASEAAAEKMSLSSAGVLTTSSNIVSGGAITGSGLLTTGGNIVIPDDGNIGSASDTNAIAISSAGVVTISTNTDATNSTSGALIAHSAGIADDLYVGDGLFVAGAITGSGAIQGTNITATTAFLPDASDGAALGSTSLEFSDLFLADGAVINFGADQDINITHVADTGLTTNGTFTATGAITSSSTMQGTTITATTAFVPDASDGAALGTSSLEFSDLFLADGGEVKFGADQDVLLRHDHNSGLIIDRTNTSDNSPTSLTLSTGETDIQADDVIGKINFQAPDEATGTDAVLVSAAIQARSESDFSSSANATSIDFMTGASEAAATKMSLTSGGDLTINTDNSKISFGADADVTLTHVADVGLTITNTNTNDNLPIILQLKSEENEVVANEVIGSLEFAAGDSDGTDGATVAAGIHAIAEGTFSASANATKLVFTTGVSETAAASATAKMTLSSGGNLTAAGTITGGGLLTTGGNIVIPDAGNIGSASDTDAIAIASNGQLTLTQTLIGTALDISGDIDVDGTSNLDVVDIDGAVDMASTLQVDGAITSSAGATLTTADNTDQLTLVSTDADANVGPSLNLYRNSGSPADSDLAGIVNFTSRNDNSQDFTVASLDASVIDVSDGTEDGRFRIKTMTNGALKTVSFVGGNISIGDSSKATFGNGDDLQIYHDGSDSYIDETGTGDLYIRANPSVYIQKYTGENMIVCSVDGSVHLYHNNFDRLQTSANGIEVLNTTGGEEALVRIKASTSGNSAIAFGDTGNTTVGKIDYNHADNSFAFDTNGGERLRIDSTGRLFRGSTTDLTGICQSFFKNIHQGEGGIGIGNNDGANTTNAMIFRNSNGNIGSIQTSSSSTIFNTSSDYRLKESVSYNFDATTRLKQLKPCRFNFKTDADKTLDGFLAHEVSSIVPEAISGEKDDTKDRTNVVLSSTNVVIGFNVTEEEWTKVKTDGIYASNTTWSSTHTEIVAQQIDQSKLVPLLVKTIQELEARITALEDA